MWLAVFRRGEPSIVQQLLVSNKYRVLQRRLTSLFEMRGPTYSMMNVFFSSTSAANRFTWPMFMLHSKVPRLIEQTLRAP